MTVSKRIDQRIQQLQTGTTFDYQTLMVEREEYAAATKALERLIKKEIIKRVTSGIFYKPKETVFGALKPNEEELLKTYLFENGKRIAYITGLSLYNKMGLTTQIPKIIKIACRDKRIYASVGTLKGKPVKSYIDVTDKNYNLLEILDAIKDFNQIQDLNVDSAILILTERLKKLIDKEISQIIQYALKYPPRTRALIGSILELMDNKINLKELKKSLNPLSEFEYNIKEGVLPNAKEWRIKSVRTK